MRIIDHSCRTPEENLALDDHLLNSGCEAIRFWESPEHFVVLGRSGKGDDEVDAAACEAAGVPVIRRSSGGGTVLQGPGCFNYTLVLSLEERPDLLNVSDSYATILRAIISGLRVPGLQVFGSDISLGRRKVSGNAQRRSRGWLLHHGTLLHGIDVSLMERILLEPMKHTAYRERRNHREFIGALPLGSV
jgi:lipoate---protein ligase